MGQWILTEGLQNLREQVNETFPNRSTASDGTIGDAAHRVETSGHNPDDTPGSKPEWDGDPDSTPEVRAWDMTASLGVAGVTTQDLVDHLCNLPGIGTVIRYMIYNRKMYHVDNGFNPTPYTGPSAHTEHVHFSGARSQTADNNTTFDYKLWMVHMDDKTLDDIADRVAERLGLTTIGGVAHVKVPYKDYGTYNGLIATVAARTDAIANNYDLDKLNAKLDTILTWIGNHA